MSGKRLDVLLVVVLTLLLVVPTASAVVPTCGNFILEPPESCDDGNTVAGDGCREDCSTEYCGDEIVDPQEQCDDGNNDPADGCGVTCQLEECGNGVVDPGEVCDDGNPDLGDGCRPDCTEEICGDGIPDPQEACDDGNPDLGDGCRPDCTAELCGDGIPDPQEGCDDGNTEPGDGCNSLCEVEECGNGVVDAGEECDDGNTEPNDGCGQTCLIEGEDCGNGVIDPGEECDDGNNEGGDGCRADCTEEICGDGILDPGEDCDDGGQGLGGCCAESDEPGCGDPDAEAIVCGFDSFCCVVVWDDICASLCQQIPECAETCVPIDGECPEDCMLPVCGDGELDPGEDCDDGNQDVGDGCRPDCTIEECGDEIVDPQEACDDGNTLWGDGCTVGCRTYCDEPVTEILDLPDSGSTLDGVAVILDETVWCAFWDMAHAIFDPAPPCNLSLVDFSTEFVFVGGVGAQPADSCHDLNIDCVDRRNVVDALRAILVDEFTARGCDCGQPGGDGGGGGDGSTPGSDCCLSNGTPGCTDPVCEAIICAADTFCCAVDWDQICADAALAEPLCVEGCGGGGGGGPTVQPVVAVKVARPVGSTGSRVEMIPVECPAP